METTIRRPPLAQSNIDLLLDFPVGAIFRRENHGTGFADSFFLRPSENALRPAAPEHDLSPGVEQEHRVIASTFDEQPEALLTFPQRIFGLLALGDVI